MAGPDIKDVWVVIKVLILAIMTPKTLTGAPTYLQKKDDLGGEDYELKE
jgi:hypothetical protein